MRHRTLSTERGIIHEGSRFVALPDAARVHSHPPSPPLPTNTPKPCQPLPEVQNTPDSTNSRMKALNGIRGRGRVRLVLCSASDAPRPMLLVAQPGFLRKGLLCGHLEALKPTCRAFIPEIAQSFRYFWARRHYFEGYSAKKSSKPPQHTKNPSQF